MVNWGNLDSKFIIFFFLNIGANCTEDDLRYGSEYIQTRTKVVHKNVSQGFKSGLL